MIALAMAADWATCQRQVSRHHRGPLALSAQASPDVVDIRCETKRGNQGKPSIRAVPLARNSWQSYGLPHEGISRRALLARSDGRRRPRRR
jgi:hypothetical protein